VGNDFVSKLRFMLAHSAWQNFSCGLRVRVMAARQLWKSGRLFLRRSTDGTPPPPLVSFWVDRFNVIYKFTLAVPIGLASASVVTRGIGRTRDSRNRQADRKWKK